MNQNPGATLPGVAEYHANDHARLNDLLLKFERLNGMEPAAANLLFNELKSGWERHIEWEEEILFPIFEARCGKPEAGATDSLRQEHVQIMDFLDQIQATLVQQWAAPIMDVLALQDLLSQHCHKEQKTLYAALDSMVNEAERAEMFAAMETNANGCPHLANP